MSNFIEIIKQDGRRLLFNTNNIISVCDMYVTKGHRVLINAIDDKGSLVQIKTDMSYDDIKSQL